MRRRIGNIFANSTTRESHPADNPPQPTTHTHRRQPAAYARGECEMYKKRSTTTACETPLGGQRLPAFPFLLLLLLFLPLIILLRSRPCRVFDYHARLHAKQRNFRHACRQPKPPATLFFSSSSPCRLSGAGSKGGAGHSSMGPSRASARAARKIAQNPT